MAEEVEDFGVISCNTSVTSTPDSELVADLKDLKVSEAADADSWCKLPQLIELRAKLRSEMMNTETQALTLEQEICDNRASEEKTLCGTCGLVKEPRQRKIRELRLMHQAMLKNKPKSLLCTAGLINRLESMILEGFLDFYCGFASNVSRCRHCRQEIDDATTKSYLLSEFIDILEDQSNSCTKTKNCSMIEACSDCLDFMLSCLKKPELFKIQDDEPKDDKNQDVDAESKNESHPPLLFQNILAQKLESFTAELTEHQETQEELVAEIAQIKENLQECATTEDMQTKLAKYQQIQTEHFDKVNSMQMQLNGLHNDQQKIYTEFWKQKGAQDFCSTAVLRMQTEIADLIKKLKKNVM